MTKKEEKPAFVKAFEKDQEKTESTIKLFDIDDFVGAADELKSQEIEGFGVVRYKKLSVEELIALHKQFKEEKIEDSAEEGLRVVAAMMYKADGKTTFEKLKKLSGDLANKLLTVLGKESGFL